MRASAAEYDRVVKACDFLAKLSEANGGVTASILVSDNDNVPQGLHGRYIVTGKGIRHDVPNLARAIVVLRSVHNAQNIWFVDAAGKRTRAVTK